MLYSNMTLLLHETLTILLSTLGNLNPHGGNSVLVVTVSESCFCEQCGNSGEIYQRVGQRGTLMQHRKDAENGCDG